MVPPFSFLHLALTATSPMVVNSLAMHSGWGRDGHVSAFVCMWYTCLWRLESRSQPRMVFLRSLPPCFWKTMARGLHIQLDWLVSKSQSLPNSRMVHSCHQIEVLQIKLWSSFFLATFLTVYLPTFKKSSHLNQGRLLTLWR